MSKSKGLPKRVELGRRALQRGRISEYLAMLLLLCKFYRILGYRVRNRAGEIDVIAKSPSGILCFIEVKARGDHQGALESLSAQQRRRIEQAAFLWLAGRRAKHVRGLRFDLVTCGRGSLPRHIQDAWRHETL